MIGYVTLGTNQFTAAAAFYDALFGSLGFGRILEQENVFIAWGPSMKAPAVSITIPYNKEPATVGNGTMVAIALKDPAQVNAFYQQALALGGSDEGEPGFRPPSDNKGFYAAYFRDLDGNKLNAFCLVE